MFLYPSVAAVIVLTFAGILHVACEVRLVDCPTTAPNAGRVEVWYPNTSEWLTVCANDWGLIDGEIVCKELGFPGIVLSKTESEYEAGRSGRSIGGFNCTGGEEYLLNCTSSDPNDRPCGEDHTAGVVCAAPGYKGCKMEIDSNSDILVDITAIPDNTVEKCLQYAKIKTLRDDGPTCAAMQGNVCSVLGLRNSQHINELSGVNGSKCDTVCKGNLNQRCGGNNLISVYSVKYGFCTDPELPNGKRAVQPSIPDLFYFGTVVDFSCNPGFVLQGALSAQCVLSSEPVQVTWSNSVPECIATATAEPGTTLQGGDGSDAALVLSILNTVILFMIIIAILIGLYCYFIRQKDSPPASPDPPHSKTESLDTINGGGDRKSTVSAPGSDRAITLQDLPEYATADKDTKRRSQKTPRTNSGFEIDEEPKRPRSKHSEHSRTQVDEKEEILGTIIVSPLANQERDRRSRQQEQPINKRDRLSMEQEQPINKEEEDGWHENETYESVETDPSYVNTRK